MSISPSLKDLGQSDAKNCRRRRSRDDDRVSPAVNLLPETLSNHFLTPGPTSESEPLGSWSESLIKRIFASLGRNGFHIHLIHFYFFIRLFISIHFSCSHLLLSSWLQWLRWRLRQRPFNDGQKDGMCCHWKLISFIFACGKGSWEHSMFP